VYATRPAYFVAMTIVHSAAVGPLCERCEPDAVRLDRRRRGTVAAGRRDITMAFILWIIAVVLVISGIVTIFRGSLLFGIILIVVGLLVGPGGVSIFT
jgi:hypothetical protein